MANTIKVRQSSVASKVPTTVQLALGELAINTTDGRLFLKKSVGGVESIIDVTAAATPLVPSGTAMLFIQTAAPTGWTKSTAHNDKALRVVSGTAGSGGTVAFTTAFASQAVSGSVGSTTAGGTVNDTTLSWNQMPSHDHKPSGMYEMTGVVANVPPGTNLGSGGNSWYGDRYMASAGSNWAHNHGFTGSSHNHSFTGTAINMAVQYVDAIIATKD